MFQENQTQDEEEKPDYMTPADLDDLEEGEAYLFSTWKNRRSSPPKESTFVRTVESIEDTRVVLERGNILFPGENMNVLERRDSDAVCFCPFEERGTYYVSGFEVSGVRPGTTVELSTDESSVTARLFYRNTGGTWIARSQDGDGPWFMYDRTTGKAHWGDSDKLQRVGASFEYDVGEEILNVPKGADAERTQTDTETRADFIRQRRGQEVDTVYYNGYSFTVARDNMVDGYDFSKARNTLEDAIHGARTAKKNSAQVWFAWDPETGELYGTHAYDNRALKPSVDASSLIDTLTEQALEAGLTLKSDPFDN
jgi:hypothetical protein